VSVSLGVLLCSYDDNVANEFRQPIVTGTSVLAIKYKDGIMMAADNLGEYPTILTMTVL